MSLWNGGCRSVGDDIDCIWTGSEEWIVLISPVTCNVGSVMSSCHRNRNFSANYRFYALWDGNSFDTNVYSDYGWLSITAILH